MPLGNTPGIKHHPKYQANSFPWWVIWILPFRLTSLEVSKINNFPLAQGQSTARHTTKEPYPLKQGPVMTKVLLSTHGAWLLPALEKQSSQMISPQTIMCGRWSGPQTIMIDQDLSITIDRWSGPQTIMIDRRSGPQTIMIDQDWSITIDRRSGPQTITIDRQSGPQTIMINRWSAQKQSCLSRLLISDQILGVKKGRNFLTYPIIN
jgi:hypothetical protein